MQHETEIDRLAQDLNRAYKNDPEFPWDDLHHPHNQFWEGPAARLLQLGWRKVGADQVDRVLEAFDESMGDWPFGPDDGETQFMNAVKARVRAALADSAGANGGE